MTQAAPTAVPSATLDLFAQQAASTVYEAAGRTGALASYIRPIHPGTRLFGRALTVRCQPGDNLTLHAAVAVAQPGDVIVADAGAFAEAGHWGEVLTVAAMQRGVAGLVIDGSVRDVAAAAKRGFPVYSHGVCMKAALKVALGTLQQPIVCAGALVHPGDLVLGDDDGVVVVRPDRAAEVLAAAQAREDAEVGIMARLAQGEVTLDILQLRGKLPAGFHHG
jgi:4-hydroxy-4-methyl-2-oxoglutarate aldolase